MFKRSSLAWHHCIVRIGYRLSIEQTATISVPHSVSKLSKTDKLSIPPLANLLFIITLSSILSFFPTYPAAVQRSDLKAAY